MYLITIFGNKGSGKTFLQMYIAGLSEKKNLFGNFKMKYKNYTKLEIIDLLNLPDNSDVFLDEAYILVEARTSNSTLNLLTTDINNLSRKTLTDIYISTIMFSWIDKRFRKQSDYIIQCENRIDLNKDDFRYTIYSKHYKNFTYLTFPYRDAKEFFNNYDTSEIISRHRKPELEFKLLEQNPKQLLKKIKNISIDIIPLLKEYTHDSIKTTLLLNGYHIGYEKYLYLYLNNKIKV